MTGKGTGAGLGAGERSTSSSWSVHGHMPRLPTDGKRLQEAEMLSPAEQGAAPSD